MLQRMLPGFGDGPLDGQWFVPKRLYARLFPLFLGEIADEFNRLLPEDLKVLQQLLYAALFLLPGTFFFRSFFNDAREMEHIFEASLHDISFLIVQMKDMTSQAPLAQPIGTRRKAMPVFCEDLFSS